MINVLIGNLFESTAQTLVNTVNCVGVMGKGIAQEFKKRYPSMFNDYLIRCKESMVKVGTPYLYKDMLGTSIINFPTKHHWRSPSKLSDIKDGLDYFTTHYRDWEITSIAFPPLGCGNGGLEWSIVGPLLYQKLSNLDIPVEIYAPYGTKSEYLKEDYLSSKTIDNNSLKGKMYEKLNENWLVIVEVIRRLQENPYTHPIGRTSYQKVCYILTKEGIDTGFRFVHGTYGPYSGEAKNAIAVLSNANLVEEKQLGQMIALRTGSEYETIKNKYKSLFDEYNNIINKTVDLLCRIKNTEQVEIIATILYSVDKLRETGPDISEQDIYDYILNWKKNWNTHSKKQNVFSSIRNLAILNWIDILPSKDPSCFQFY